MNKKINTKKKKEVEGIVSYIKKYKAFGILDLENMPSAQLQKMRSQLKPNALISMSKKRLIKIALNNVKADKQNIDAVIESIKGMPALLFTDDNPFKVYRLINKSKSAAPAKPGQTSPNDITIPAGPTPFAPGPIISELGQLGIKTEVKEGKVALKEDKLLVKENQVISDKVASLLSKLGIEPMEIGLNVIAIYENGTIYKKDVLAIDDIKVMADLKQISWDALALALELCYIDKDTINLLILKAHLHANALSLKANINGG
ncbi:50S ribosomal protein L10 [Candidatus Woesearchaeota archaeon]|nr:50S ribosomal protein L10 [Candidatus Woesearchaeota archaeon]